jgi:hypothetical protein
MTIDVLSMRFHQNLMKKLIIWFTIRYIAKYPFTHSEFEVYQYFRQLHSSFVVREV